MKRSCILLALLFPPLCALADGEEWRADLAADSVHNVYLRRGDATTLRAELYVRGREYLPSTAVAKYRTNLVDQTWLQAPATIASNTVSFAWTPFLAPGADVVPFVFYVGEVYRAPAMIYLRASPDAGSDEARAVLDLDAYDITNAPWATPGDLAAAIGSIDFPEPDYSSSNAALVATIQAVAPAPGNYETVSNRAMSAVQTESDPVFATWLGADPLATYAPTGHVHASVVAGDTTLAAVSGGTASVIREKPGCLRFEQSSFVASFHDTAAEIGSWTLPTIELDVVYDGVAYSALGTLEELGEDEFAYSLESGLSWLDGAHFETYDSYTVFYDLGDGAPARHLGDGTGETLSTYTWRDVSTLATVSDLAAVSNALDAVVATIGPAATNYTDSAKTIALAYASAVSNTLDAAIRAAEPGDYAVVSNRAMSAIQTERDPLYAEWTRTNQIATALAGKQSTIADLDTIRSGAAAGATALQSYTETDPTVPAWAKSATKPAYTAAEVGALATEEDPVFTAWVSTNVPSGGGADMVAVSNAVSDLMVAAVAENPVEPTLEVLRMAVAELWESHDKLAGLEAYDDIAEAIDAMVSGPLTNYPPRTEVAQNLAGYVPTSRTVNNKALSANVTLSASDVGALPVSGYSAISPADIGSDPYIYVEFYGSTRILSYTGTGSLEIGGLYAPNGPPCHLVLSGFSSVSWPSYWYPIVDGTYDSSSANYYEIGSVNGQSYVRFLFSFQAP